MFSPQPPPRLLAALADSDVIACEDTRNLSHLAKALGITLKARLVSLHDHNERDAAAKIVELAREADVLLVSDAGMPTISDPGYNLVRACAEADIEVSVIPGPSAVIAALAISGLATDRFTFEGFLPRKSGERKKLFTFEGFLPRKSGERKKLFQSLSREERTMIFFEAPHRILETLEDAASVLGDDRQAAVVRELTKKFEHAERGTLKDLVDWAKTEPRGEMVLVIAGAQAEEHDYEELAKKALQLAAEGVGMKAAAAELARVTGASKSVIYEHALRLKA
ncbi:MAG: rRNA small subunit methyltransferase 1 [Actinobacteria bacterium]|nr:rRNA small subunit methyltransferase 1 [Actinomycetota bacterium]